jgi:hypothetical protein
MTSKESECLNRFVIHSVYFLGIRPIGVVSNHKIWLTLAQLQQAVFEVGCAHASGLRQVCH